MMQIGPYKLSAIHTGTLWLDGGSMFGTVPYVLWSKTNPPDEKFRIELAMRALLLQGEGRTILVDCGLGDKGGDKFKENFKVDQETNNVDRSLSKLGLSRGDITDVFLTHLHFDHAGGATEATENGYQASFPNATYHIQRKNLELAKNPNPRERASYLPENYQALESEKRLSILDGPMKNWIPMIDVIVSDGHTEAQQHVKVSDGEKTLFYGGDLIPTSTHVPVPWMMGYDVQPLVLLEEKKRILELAGREKWVIFFEHDPYHEAALLEETKKGFLAGERFSI